MVPGPARRIISSGVAVIAAVAVAPAVALASALPARAGDQPRAVREGQAAAAPWRLVFSHRYGTKSAIYGYWTIVAPDRTDAWAMGGMLDSGVPVAARWHDGHWRVAALPGGVAGPIEQASAVSPSDIWAVSMGGDVLHWNGKAWHIARYFKSNGSVLTGVTAFSPANVWVFGGSGFAQGLGTWHLHNGTWTKVTGIAGNIGQASASAPDNIWAVTDIEPPTTFLVRYNGTSWRKVTFRALKGYALFSVLTLGPGNLWLLAGKDDRTRLLHLRGTKLTTVAAPAKPFATGGLIRDGHGGLWMLGETSPGHNFTLHLSSSGRWMSYPFGAGGTGPQDLALIPGTDSVWGSGVSVGQGGGGDATIWGYTPAS
jgi:hypothetical protein